MDTIAAARELLPPWVVWGNLLLYPLLAFLLSLFGAWLGVRIASLPLRHLAPSAHWTERARRTFPALLVSRRIGLFSVILFVALGFVFSGAFNRVPGGVLSLLGGASAYVAATCIRWGVVRRAGLGAAGLRAWLRGLLSDGLIFFSYLPIAVLLFALLPDRLDTTALIVLVVALALLFYCAWGGGLSVASSVGLARPADERLQNIVEKAASKAGIQPRATYEVGSTMTNAAAFQLSKRLVFTQSILRVLDDEELTAVCVHELGHLSESLLVVLCRLSPLLLVASFASARLIFALGGLPAITGLNVLFLLLIFVFARLSQRMERRADRIAGSDEETARVYARALEKIYQSNLFPAVLRGRLSTHPHLYDRLLAAGVTPAYDRPRPPPRAFTTLAFTVPFALFVLLGVGRAALPFALFYTPMRDSEPAILWSLAVGGDSYYLRYLAYLHYKRGDIERGAVFSRAVADLERRKVAQNTAQVDEDETDR